MADIVSANFWPILLVLCWGFPTACSKTDWTVTGFDESFGWFWWMSWVAWTRSRFALGLLPVEGLFCVALVLVKEDIKRRMRKKLIEIIQQGCQSWLIYLLNCLFSESLSSSDSSLEICGSSGTLSPGYQDGTNSSVSYAFSTVRGFTFKIHLRGLLIMLVKDELLASVVGTRCDKNIKKYGEIS